MSIRLSHQAALVLLLGVFSLACVLSCAASNARGLAATNATYQADRTIVYKQALETVSSMYPVEDSIDPANRVIYTRWQLIRSTGSAPSRVQEFDSKEDRRLRGGGGYAENGGENRIRYIRFQIEVVGDSPWQIRVTGLASETAPSLLSRPTLLRPSEYPPWFRSRIHEVQQAIHQSLKVYAVEFDNTPRSWSEPLKPPTQASSTGEVSPHTESWPATMHVRGTEPGMLVSALSERVDTNGGERESSAKFYWKELCTLPCSFRLMPGLQNVRVESKDGWARESFKLQPGSSTYLLVEPGNESLSTIAGIVSVASLAGILVGSGAMLWQGIEPWSLWTVGGGFGGLVLGVGVGVMSLPSITKESAPNEAMTSKAISLSGSF